MPYVMVMGSLSAPHLSKDDGATVYGLKSEERAALVRELNSAFGMAIATSSDLERTVKVTQKGLTLVVVNRLHGLLGYDVVSHAMAMTNANRELVSFTLYKKSSPSSKGHSHGHGHGTSSHNTSSHSTSSHSASSHSASSHSTPSHTSPSHTHGTSHKSHTQGNVITTL